MIARSAYTSYAFPNARTRLFSGATGNTYHFVRLPADFAGKQVDVQLRCQLGSDITYLLNPPLIGSKATMLNADVMRSMPAFTLAGCMMILSIGLGVLYFAFRKRLGLNNATLYTALFTLLFAVYVYFETSFAQVLMPNGYLLCFLTLTLLALMPIPLIGVFLNAVDLRFRKVMAGAMLLCAVNLCAQAALNALGVWSIRAMLPATHACIIVSIAAAVYCLLFSDRVEKPDARRALLSAVPMIAGGVADIVLLNLERPSFNNCLWFTVGVTIFIVHQLCGYIRSYFRLYRTSLEAALHKQMAYRDALAGIENRNAYERKLKALSEAGASGSEGLCCIVADINDLKRINDTLGHRAGDTAIAAVGAILNECMPPEASYFRSGGDEFVVLLERFDVGRTRALAEKLFSEAAQRGQRCGVPLSLAIGAGQYEAADGTVVDFIRRVDTRMYECKRRQKAVAGAADGRQTPPCCACEPAVKGAAPVGPAAQ